MKRLKKEKKILQSPKGMRDIFDNDFYKMQGFFELAQEICVYYGFKPIETPVMEYGHIFEKGIGGYTDIVDKEMYYLKTKGGDSLVLRPEYTAGIIRAYIEHGMHNIHQPVQLYSFGPLFRHDRPQAGRYREHRQFNMEIIGSEKSVLDAMVIQVANLILAESGIKNFRLLINSIGDRESRKEYIKKLVSFYKKNAGDLAAKDRARLTKNPLRILDSKEPETIEVNQNVPQILNFLNNESKKHFEQVLEYLEHAGVYYQIDHTLVRGQDYYSHTVFEFFADPEREENDTDEEETGDKEVKLLSIGGGGRYDGLAEILGNKKPVPAVGCGLGLERILAITKKNLEPKIIKKAKIFFIQIGQEAKIKSFQIIEILRNKKIPVHHSLSKDSLGSQLAAAEKMEVPYVIIFGQKEAMGNEVIVRNMTARSQKIVAISKLADYLKGLK